jgi:hypothetical protein
MQEKNPCSKLTVYKLQSTFSFLFFTFFIVRQNTFINNSSTSHVQIGLLEVKESTRRVSRPAVMWLDSIEDLKTMGVRHWRQKSQDRNQW